MHTYVEGIVHVVSATDARTGSAIERIAITDVTIDGQQLRDLEYDLFASIPVNGIELRGDTPYCTIDCDVGTEPGEWVFTASAPGFNGTETVVDAAYAGGSKTGCMSTAEDGTEVSIVLEPEA
ncbi:MAG: hypothetical protein ACRENI_13415 [Gemmatimonadaceae bacterium]